MIYTTDDFRRLRQKHELANSADAGFHLPHQEFEMIISALRIAEAVSDPSAIEAVVTKAVHDFSSPIVGRGDVHGGQTGYIIYERDGLPFLIGAIIKRLAK